jgi:SAM-dependent methyltransferase
VRTVLRRLLRPQPPVPAASEADGLVELTDEDRRYLTTLYDDTTPLPEGAEAQLRSDNPRLLELRAAYAALDLPVTVPSRWADEHVEAFLDLRYFRGETLITWHYRELPRITRLKYFLYLTYVAARDEHGLLGRLREDGAFGCWTFEYPGRGKVSRDLLESVNELSFLARHVELEGARVLDVGAGYGRLAHRMTEAFAVADYCCVDAVAESTFLCEAYLRHRGAVPPARVVALHEVPSALEPGAVDLACNVHSFSECTFEAISWWVHQLAALRIPRLFLVPNEPTELLSLEQDGSRRDFAPVLEQAGYALLQREPVIADAAVRELVDLHDHFHLYALRA